MRLPPVSLTLLTSHPRRNKGTEWSPPFLEDESFIISEKQQKRLVQELAFIAFHGGNAANFSNILYFHTSKILSFKYILNMKSGEIFPSWEGSLKKERNFQTPGNILTAESVASLGATEGNIIGRKNK